MEPITITVGPDCITIRKGRLLYDITGADVDDQLRTLLAYTPGGWGDVPVTVTVTEEGTLSIATAGLPAVEFMNPSSLLDYVRALEVAALTTATRIHASILE